MAQHPMLPLWTDAYLGDTTHLTTIEHGAYLLLLIAMWRTPEKRLPKSDKLLARYARLTSGQWARIKPVLMPFFTEKGEFISQSRLTDEATAVRQLSQRQSDKAKARWLKEKGTDDAAAMPDACLPTLPTSVSKDTAEEADEEPDLRKLVYAHGKKILGKSKGSLITQAIAQDGLEATISMLEQTRREDPIDPVAYFVKCRKVRAANSDQPGRPSEGYGCF